MGCGQSTDDVSRVQEPASTVHRSNNTGQFEELVERHKEMKIECDQLKDEVKRVHATVKRNENRYSQEEKRLKAEIERLNTTIRSLQSTGASKHLGPQATNGNVNTLPKFADEDITPLGSVGVKFGPLLSGFSRGETVVDEMFTKTEVVPQRGQIRIDGVRYMLTRPVALSSGLYEIATSLFGFGREAEGRRFARGLLYDLAVRIGRMEAETFADRMGLKGPDLFNVAPSMFSYCGWGFVDFLPESRVSSQPEDICLVFEHRWSFEAKDFRAKHGVGTQCMCNFSCGFLAGFMGTVWGGQCKFVTVEFLCEARGDHCCRFITSATTSVEKHLQEYCDIHMPIPGWARLKQYVDLKPGNQSGIPQGLIVA